MKKSKKSLVLVALLFLFVILLSQCIGKSEASNDPRGNIFASSASCRQCHQAIYDSAILSAHTNASSLASKNNIHGNFNVGKNTFIYDQNTEIAMENRDSGMYQVLYVNGKEKEAHRFDIAFGLRKAQTSMYWQDDKIYQFPLTYYTSANNWATSPGFSSKEPYFKRLVQRECFECHSSYLKNKEDVVIPNGEYFGSEVVRETLEKKSLILGIDCQRCHGPAANHVNYHLAYPEEKTAKYIVTNSALSQQQKLDRCAVCHSGNNKEKLKSIFYFMPGDTLSNFYLDMPGNNNRGNLDVHGNQYGLLLESKCFLVSKTMNCSSCHNPHSNATNNLLYYSQKCMSCHSIAKNNFCTVIPSSGISLTDNCIDCHMPKKPSAAISFQLSGSTQYSSYLLRTHKIAIYPMNNEK